MILTLRGPPGFKARLCEEFSGGRRLHTATGYQRFDHERISQSIPGCFFIGAAFHAGQWYLTSSSSKVRTILEGSTIVTKAFGGRSGLENGQDVVT